MRHDWGRDRLVLRHLAAFPLGGLLAATSGLAFANLQPWARGLSFIGSLWLAIAVWVIAVLAAYLSARPRRLVAVYGIATLLCLLGVIVV